MTRSQKGPAPDPEAVINALRLLSRALGREVSNCRITLSQDVATRVRDHCSPLIHPEPVRYGSAIFGIPLEIERTS